MLGSVLPDINLQASARLLTLQADRVVRAASPARGARPPRRCGARPTHRPPPPRPRTRYATRSQAERAEAPRHEPDPVRARADPWREGAQSSIEARPPAPGTVR